MRLERAAIRGRMSAHTLLNGRVDGTVRLTTGDIPVRENYTVLSLSIPEEDTSRFTAVTYADADREVVFGVQCVAVDEDGVDRFIEAVKTQLLGHVLIIEGRTCTPIRRLPDVEEGEVRYDRTARLFYAHMSFAFWSKKAAS